MINMTDLLKGKHVGKILDLSVWFHVVGLGPTGGSNKKRQIVGQLEFKEVALLIVITI